MKQPLKSRNRSGIIERTLTDINNTLEQSVFAEKISRRGGLLQVVDPRIKLISMIVFLLTVGLTRQLAVLGILCAFTFLLAALSAIPIGFFIKRVWGFVLLFTGIIALPAIFITPGPAIADLPFGLSVTKTGVQTALFLILRSGTSVSFTILTILTTPWADLLKALGVLRVPDVPILILGMTYRYIHLFLHLTDEMFLSRKSRTLRKLSGKEERRLVGEVASHLLGKSLHLSSEVYLAMESRGYRGYPKTINVFQIRWVDWCYSGAMLAILSAALWFGK